MFNFLTFRLFRFDFVVDFQYGRQPGRRWLCYECLDGGIEIWVRDTYLCVSLINH